MRIEIKWHVVEPIEEGGAIGGGSFPYDPVYSPERDRDAWATAIIEETLREVEIAFELSPKARILIHVLHPDGRKEMLDVVNAVGVPVTLP